MPRRRLTVSKRVAKTRHVLSSAVSSWTSVSFIAPVKKSVQTVAPVVRATSVNARLATKCLVLPSVRNGTLFNNISKISPIILFVPL